MPYVKIQVTNEGVTSEQKQKLIQGATRLLHEILDKDPRTTFVIIEEVSTDSWGIAGESVTVIRERERKNNANQ